MSKNKLYLRWKAIGLAAAVILGILVVSRSMIATAAPPMAPVAGITVTPTQEPTITVSPTVPTLTPTPKPTRPTPKYTDPVILKSADPAEAWPGEEVTFTVIVRNEGNIAAVDVVVTDDIPAYLEIVEVTSTQGEIAIDGQRITVEVGTIGPEFEVRIVIRTVVRADTPAPLTVENVAILSCPNCDEKWARAEVVVKGGDAPTPTVVCPPGCSPVKGPPSMPSTGGLGTWWMVAACLGTGLVGISLALSGRQER
jgi:uncharacterized repeat protein (TIGR01451 family)